MFEIINVTTKEIIAEAETLESAWAILSDPVKDANAKKLSFEWNICDTEERTYLL